MHSCFHLNWKKNDRGGGRRRKGVWRNYIVKFWRTPLSVQSSLSCICLTNRLAPLLRFETPPRWKIWTRPLCELGTQVLRLILSRVAPLTGMLQRYSQSQQLHGSRPFHWFAWYNSCGTEKCPLAVNGSCQQERPPETILYSGRSYGGFVNSTVKGRIL